MKYKINNHSSADLNNLLDILPKFLTFARDMLGFTRPTDISFVSDAENAENLFGKTGFYDPSDFSITIYADNRHSKDILRSLSHELVHHTQNCRGEFEEMGQMGPGYAQNNPHMREMEIEAYKMGNVCLRDFEDQHKQFLKEHNYYNKGVLEMNTKDWKNIEINSLLMEKWNYKKKMEENEELEEGCPGEGYEEEPIIENEEALDEQKVRNYVREALQKRLKDIRK